MGGSEIWWGHILAAGGHEGERAVVVHKAFFEEIFWPPTNISKMYISLRSCNIPNYCRAGQRTVLCESYIR